MPSRPLTIREILDWATAHREATGRWPTAEAGSATRFETWAAVDSALRMGYRGLPGGSSLAHLLVEQRNAHNPRLQPLAETTILAWADAHFARTQTWPTHASGVIPDSSGEKWSNAENALARGGRGLTGGSSLARFLALYRGVRNPGALPALEVEQVIAWAQAHWQRTGHWPTKSHRAALFAHCVKPYVRRPMFLPCSRRSAPAGRSSSRGSRQRR